MSNPNENKRKFYRAVFPINLHYPDTADQSRHSRLSILSSGHHYNTRSLGMQLLKLKYRKAETTLFGLNNYASATFHPRNR